MAARHSTHGGGRSSLTVLGIECSCDDTAVAIVRRNDDHTGTIRAARLATQIDRHRPYGGIVPEIAARRHIDILDPCIRTVLDLCQLKLSDLDGIAATAGPGLIGGLLVGLTTAKALALASDLPLLAINHLEAHALTVRLTDGVAFPYLLLLVSGGHCQLVIVHGVGRYQILGSTRDDAPGEAFDKAARLLGFEQPGGPMIERAAARGDPTRLDLPRPMLGHHGCDFSFSGLKTALRRHCESGRIATNADRDNAAAAFQAAIVDTLADRTEQAIQIFLADSAIIDSPTQPCLVAAGGVAANGIIRQRLSTLARRHGMIFIVPSPDLCTDNGAMVAWAGLERLHCGAYDALDAVARPRWPLSDLTPPVAQ